MMSLKPYPEYQDSELPWVGKIPAHWQILRNGGLFAHRVETGYPDLPILEVSLRTGVTIRDFGNTKRKQMMSQREKYKRARQGDIAYNMMRMWQGAVGVAPVDGLVSPAYVVVQPYAGTDSRYFNYLFGTQAYKAEVNKYSRGIVADRNRLYWDDFKQMSSIVPSLDEQSKIAAFLRTQDRQIAKLIRGKRRLIELLNEQKQTIIHRAVTRGLNPDVPLKPSGIDWLGDVPAHWDIFRIKALANNVVEQTSEKVADELYIALEHIEGWSGKFLVENREGGFQSQVKRFQAGDVLFGKLRPYLAKVVRPKNPGVCVGEFLVLRPRGDESIAQFFEVMLRSRKVIDLINSSTYGAKMPRAEWGFIGNVRVTLPPTLDERQRIVAHIASETMDIDRAIQTAGNEITLIREYRDRLISDVVTGQIDVRGWQPVPDDESDTESLTVLSEVDENGESLDDDEEVSDV